MKGGQTTGNVTQGSMVLWDDMSKSPVVPNLTDVPGMYSGNVVRLSVGGSFVVYGIGGSGWEGYHVPFSHVLYNEAWGVSEGRNSLFKSWLSEQKRKDPCEPFPLSVLRHSYQYDSSSSFSPVILSIRVVR